MGCEIAGWSPQELEFADKTAREVIYGITHGKFWPLEEVAPAFSEAFAAICQDNRIGKRNLLQEEEEVTA